MAFGDWTEVVQVYKDIYLNTSYSFQAKAMIELIPRIQSLPEFKEILPGTTHGTLFFSVDGRVDTVNVWYSEDGIYTIYFYHPSKGEYNKLTATSEDILSKLQASVKHLESADIED